MTRRTGRNGKKHNRGGVTGLALPEKTSITYQSGYGSMMSPGPSPTTPPIPGGIETQGGRRFGTPPPGWIGAGGVAQIPHPNRGMRSGGGGPMGGVQTYGSLGYGSMGDGSMDMAVRQEGRRFSGLFCPKGYYMHCHKPFDCHCIKGARFSSWWAKRPSPLLPDKAPTPGKRIRFKRPARTRRRRR